MASQNVTPVKLLAEALEFIQTNALKRTEIDWELLRAELLPKNKGLTTLEKAHEEIRRVIRQLDDDHSSLWTPEQIKDRPIDLAGFRLHQNKPVIIDVFPQSPAEMQGIQVGDSIVSVNGVTIDKSNWRQYFRNALKAGSDLVVRNSAGQDRQMTLETGFNLVNPVPKFYRTSAGVGVIDLPGHLGDGILPDGRQYAQVVQEALYDLEAQGVRRWIIDLRRNDGGNMWPMLAGLTPLLGLGTYGAFVDPVAANDWDWRFDGKTLGTFKKYDGKAGEGSLTIPNYHALNGQTVPVAVLTSEVTSSSGEMILIALLGRDTTRTFGEKTGGLTSSNALKVLQDGSWLLVMSSWAADRLGHVYRDAINPDISVPIDWSNFGTKEDPVILKAVQWLEQTART